MVPVLKVTYWHETQLILETSHLAKLYYVTTLDFPEIAGDFPSLATIWGFSVVWGRELIWPDPIFHQRTIELREEEYLDVPGS